MVGGEEGGGIWLGEERRDMVRGRGGRRDMVRGEEGEEGYG